MNKKIDFEFVDMIRRCHKNNLENDRLFHVSEHYEVESRLIEVIDQLKERAEEAEFCLNHINSNVFPGEIDSLDSMKQIVREHAELLKKVDELEALLSFEQVQRLAGKGEELESIEIWHLTEQEKEKLYSDTRNIQSQDDGYGLSSDDLEAAWLYGFEYAIKNQPQQGEESE